MQGIRSSFPSLGQIDGNARYLTAAGALVNFGAGYFIVARPVYLYAAGFDPTVIGVLIAVQSFLGVILAIPIAMMSDIFGRKRFVVYGLLLDGIGSFLFFYSTNLAALVAAQVLFAFVTAAASSPFIALFMESTNEDNRNGLFVILSFVGGIAMAMGSFGAGLPVVLERMLGTDYLWGFRLIFLAVAITSLSSGAVVFRSVSEKPRAGSAMGSGGLSLSGLIKIPRKSMGVVKKFSIIGFTGFGAGLIIPLLPLWYNLKFGVDVSIIGPLFGSIFLTTALASLFTPAIARRRGNVFTIIATELSGVVLLVSVPLAPDYLSAGGIMVVRSTFANMSSPIMQSFMMGLVHPDERATASSMIQMFDSVPRAYAPAIGGYLLSVGLIDLPFYMTAVLYVVSITLFYFFFRRMEPTRS
ncbi:MAG: MFS transporter [Nitrososphaerota archaeon]|nr:MFS transporter [Nitrososphaerota archaeon]